MTAERTTYTEVQPWDHDVVETEFESRIVEPEEDGTVPGHDLLGFYEARRPFEDYRGKVSWAQAVLMDHDDAVFARFRESQLYTAHVPVAETQARARGGGRLGGFVSKLLRRD